MQKVYRAALYERVSREDGEDAPSESIRVQRQLLEEYCLRSEELSIAGHYSDDGYSGVCFDRPAFNEMIRDIEAGCIDCVVVKDLSRFGRDLILAGEYLERVFPRLGVRFIAINDNMDSVTSPYDGIRLPVVNLMNAQYAEDISKKVRTALSTRRAQGKYLCPSPPYGYDKAAGGDGSLIPNGDSETVRQIYAMYLGGMGKTAIASELNRREIPCPGVRRAESGFYKRAAPNTKNWAWSIFSVDRLLRDPVYAGDTPEGKSRKSSMHDRAFSIPRERWIIHRDTHPAIIGRQEWEQAQAMLAGRSTGRAFRGSGSLFAGLIYCGACGGRMKLVNYHGRGAYFCTRYKTGGPCACGSHRIYEAKLSRIVLEDVNRLIEKADVAGICGSMAEDARRRKEKSLAALALAMSGLAMDKRYAYERYKNNKLNRNEFTEIQAALEHRMEKLRQTICEEESAPCTAQWLNRLANERAIIKLDRATIGIILDCVKVFPNGVVQIRYRWGE